MNIAAITIAIAIGLFLWLGFRRLGRYIERSWKEFKKGWRHGY